MLQFDLIIVLACHVKMMDIPCQRNPNIFNITVTAIRVPMGQVAKSAVELSNNCQKLHQNGKSMPEHLNTLKYPNNQK